MSENGAPSASAASKCEVSFRPPAPEGSVAAGTTGTAGTAGTASASTSASAPSVSDLPPAQLDALFAQQTEWLTAHFDIKKKSKKGKKTKMGKKERQAPPSSSEESDDHQAVEDDLRSRVSFRRPSLPGQSAPVVRTVHAVSTAASGHNVSWALPLCYLAGR